MTVDMRICFFNLNRLDYEGGAEKYFVDLAEELRRKNYEVSFVCDSDVYVKIRPRLENIIYRIIGAPRHEKFKDAKKVKRETGKINIHNLPLSFHLPFSEQRRKIKKVLKEAEIIYCKNEFIDSTYLRWLIGNRAFSKVILGIHTAIFLEKTVSFQSKIHNILYFSRIYKKNIKLCGAVHVINNAYKEQLSQYYDIAESKVVLIPYGLTEEEFNDNFLQPNQYFKILFAGRLTEQKGIDYLETLIVNLARTAEFSEMEFIIAGSGGLEEVPYRLSQRFANVKFVGFIKDMKQLYRDIDIAIVLSRWETFGYNCLEPQARGIPVVVFDIPGPQDIIVNGLTGKLVPLGKIEQFQEAILELFHLKKENPSLFRLMKTRAFQNTFENFYQAKVIEKMIIFLNETKQKCFDL